MRRAARAFGEFWWDFLIGDTPEFLVVALVVVALAFALRTHRSAGVVVLPLLTATAVAFSAWRVRRR
jgi:lipopolysaccharide export LptBFGC system permease protein LptF